jgi:hypothetical protein
VLHDLGLVFKLKLITEFEVLVLGREGNQHNKERHHGDPGQKRLQETRDPGRKMIKLLIPKLCDRLVLFNKKTSSGSNKERDVNQLREVKFRIWPTTQKYILGVEVSNYLKGKYEN